ncbi:MAG: flagellar biosynthesis protein FlhB [Rhodothermaceae bacterium]
MADSGGQEKTEEASGKRLDESRSKGQVAKSQEINSIAIFGVGLILIFAFKDFVGEKLGNLAKFIFGSLDSLELSMAVFQTYVYKGFMFVMVTLAPFFIGLVIIALVAGYGQAGFKITPKALIPKFEQLDPIKGIKNKFFSITPMIELTKALIKFVAISLFAYWELSDTILFSAKLLNYTVAEIVSFMVEKSYSFLWKIGLIYLVFSFADFAYQKFKHKKDLKMTKQEVKEENKDTEGDPLLKGKIKGKQMEMAQRRMMQDVPQADVVITNPTHVAVALKYDVGGSGAPKVLAKGLDNVAQKIKEIAKENNIHMHEDVQLARALYKQCEIGHEIPEDLFKAVAQILAYVYRLKNNKKKSIV